MATISKQTVTIEGSPMDIWISEPEGAGPHPAIVICIHAPANFGIENDPFSQDLMQRYAAAG
ncbi:MAG: hypothetical protein VW268_02395 [Rhodospirillaceae bacterium]